MNEHEAVLNQFHACSLDSILSKLYDIRQRYQRQEEVEIPVATYHLRSGQSIKGTLLDIAEEKAERYVLIHTSDNGDRHPSYDVSYLAVRDLAGVTIHQAASVAPTLSDGTVYSIPGKQAPSNMILQRRAQVISKTLPDINLDLEPGSLPNNEQRWQFKHMLEILAGVLHRITEDITTRAVLAELHTITLTTNSTFNVQRTNQQLTITCDLANLPEHHQLYDALIRKL